MSSYRILFSALVSVLLSFSALASATTSEFDEVSISSSFDFQPDGSDQDLINAVSNRRKVNFVEGDGMVVTKVLPEDNDGLRHQKWMVRLSNGASLQAVYNSDMCPHVPIREGDVVAMGGMFLWTNQGPMIHWLHHDPRGHRPDGYVKVNGKFYCKE
jgi:hypothetical protein